jgi:hypothetical protein
VDWARKWAVERGAGSTLFQRLLIVSEPNPLLGNLEKTVIWAGDYQQSIND